MKRRAGIGFILGLNLLPALAEQVNDTTARRFADRDLYLVVADIASGRIVAHGGNHGG